MAEPPVLELPQAPQFMCVDGKTFLVERVALSPQHMLKNVEDFYKDNLAVLKERMVQHISDESQIDLDIQVQRIERHLASGVVALPDDARENGSIIMVQNNRAFKTRIVLFKPTRISITLQRVAEVKQWVDQAISRRDAERFTKFNEWATPMIQHYRDLNQDSSAIKVDLLINQDLVQEAMVVGLVPTSHTIFVYPDNKHCHVHQGSCNLCTGQATAENFWDDPQFIMNFNSVNPHSFANTSTFTAQNWKQMLKNQYFVEARIRTAEVTAWRV